MKTKTEGKQTVAERKYFHAGFGEIRVGVQDMDPTGPTLPNGTSETFLKMRWQEAGALEALEMTLTALNAYGKNQETIRELVEALDGADSFFEADALRDMPCAKRVKAALLKAKATPHVHNDADGAEGACGECIAKAEGGNR